MGAWGEGLLDNDRALDALAELFDSLVVEGPEELATHVGLSAWLHPPLRRRTVVRLGAEAGSLSKLPTEVRALLSRAASDPEGFCDGRSRSAAALEVLGRYCDGPRYDALLHLHASAGVIERLAADAAEER